MSKWNQRVKMEAVEREPEDDLSRSSLVRTGELTFKSSWKNPLIQPERWKNGRRKLRPSF